MRNAAAILTGWYAGEVGGEALFNAQAARSSPDAARKWLALARVEAALASKLAVVMAERRIPIPAIEDAAGRAQQRCEATAGKSWPEIMQWLHRLAAAALEQMQADAATLPVELDAIGKLVVDHEMALVAFAQRELKGDAAKSLQPIDAFLGALA
jgi:hypothetical protein